MTTYADFLATKVRRAGTVGRDCDQAEANMLLHDWQREIVAWAVRKGRAAIWADTGLGKTFMQIEWARLSVEGSDSEYPRALIVAPLAVCQQTIREGAKLGVDIRYLREDDGLGRIIITNFETIDRFAAETFDAVVLDEASILKQSDGKTRTKLIEHFASVPARLACTATPAPNDPEELTSQAEFLGVMPRVEMLASFFVHDAEGWRPKGWALQPMYRWLASWAVALRRPSDIGYDDAGYILPALNIVPEVVDAEIEPEDGALFVGSIGGVSGRARIRRATLNARIQRAVELVDEAPKGEPWLFFVGLNDEQDALAREFGEDAFSISGSMTPESKVDLLYRWIDGERPILISKTSIIGMGINAQHCSRLAFVGLSDSFEAFYQGVRRCWRYGQQSPVFAHIVVSHVESEITTNVQRKERSTARMVDGLVAAMRKEWTR